jgi:ketosteroid isomerase-like protein
VSTTGQAVEVVKAAYAAFGSGDLPAILALVADNVDWKFYGARGLPYTGAIRTKDQVAKWFASIPEADEIQAFEPREFISGGEHVTVLGWERTRTRPAGKVFETEWVHVFTVRAGLIVRFWGMYDTEASAKARA